MNDVLNRKDMIDSMRNNDALMGEKQGSLFCFLNAINVLVEENKLNTNRRFSDIQACGSHIHHYIMKCI